MESTQLELKQLEVAVSDANQVSSRELMDLQLVTLGGGAGEVALL